MLVREKIENYIFPKKEEGNKKTPLLRQWGKIT